MPSKKTILIVDDNQLNRSMLKTILGGDYFLLEADNGAAALQILREKGDTISAVLLDLIMPVLDGFEVLRKMNGEPTLSNIPVIVATGQNTEDVELKALSLGANDFIGKPYKPEIIKRRMANTIKLKETAALVNSVQHDALTGLFAKEHFYELVSETLQENPDKNYDLICFDIEQFKLVNDRYGMKVGDELLIHVAKLISANVGDSGICCRLGSDEFACLVPSKRHYNKDWFIKYIDQVNEFSEDIRLNIVLRFGIYTIEDPTTPVNIMCDRAMLAKDAIKGKYDNYFSIYDDTIRQKLLNEQSIVSEMKAALAQNQFQVYFQPKYDLSTEEIIGAEALVRWLHPQKGLMYPGSFIPLFEKNGFIADLDYYVWEQCCQKMKKWRDEGNNITPISINVSRVDIYDPDLPDKLISLIKKYELSPKVLHLEITESAYTENPKQLITMVTKLKKLGFIIEMDDFGTGYSSLNMLSELPIDILKLDMRFIQKEEKKHGDRSILSFIISLAKWMNLQVVAEGIETIDQVQMLRSLSCEFAQGYYYAKPMPLEQFEQHLLNARIKYNHKQEETLHEEKLSADEPGTILILDPACSDYAMFLNAYGHEYRKKRVDSAYQILELLNSDKAMIRAVSVSLPGNYELKLLREITSLCKKLCIPIVLIYDTHENPGDEMLALPFSDILKRPYNAHQLRMRFQNVLAGAKLRKIEQEQEVNAAVIEMRRRAEHDSITGLLNRAEYEVRLDHFFLNNDEPKGIFLILDADNFKRVNDTFGQEVGDKVLNAIGQQIYELFPETEMVARIGGDEFSLFIPYILPYSQLEDKLKKLCGRFNLKFKNITISCSAGVCYAPEYGTNHKDLYKNADMALINAKRHGKRHFEVFKPGMEVITPAEINKRTMDMLDYVSDAMFVSDALTSEIIYINETACKVLKMDKKSCLGKKCYQLFWHRNFRCERCTSIDEHCQDFYEEDVLLTDSLIPLHLRARLEDWDGRKVKVHYL